MKSSQRETDDFPTAPLLPARSTQFRFARWLGSGLRGSLIVGSMLFLTAGSVQAQANLESLEAFIEGKLAEEDRAAIEAEAQRRGLPLFAVQEDGRTVSLKKFDDNGRPVYYINDNLNAADTVSTDEVWSGGSLGLSLDGAGQTLGEWDAGAVRATHQEFTGRVTQIDAPASQSSHATHVAGTLIASGVNSIAIGMSSAAVLRAWDFNDDDIEMAAEQMLPAAVRISNHSYGFIGGWRNGSFGCAGDPQWYWFGDVQASLVEDVLFGFYHDSAADWDQIAYDSPLYLMVKSSGNDRGEGPTSTVMHCHYDSALSAWIASSDDHPVDGGATGFDTIGSGSGSAKNVLTLGAVIDISGGYSGPGSVVASSFHGWGPTDDGRIKPDLVANGVSLISSTATSDSAYGSFSGTSMSTPNTAGSLGLLHQHAANLGQEWIGSTYKALVINTADESGTSPGPDYVFGWGLLNTANAADLLSRHGTGDAVVIEGQLTDNGVEVIGFAVPAGVTLLKATLVWTDPAGTPPPQTTLDPPDLMLVNDLDLSVEGPSLNVFEPWILDPSNPSAGATTGDNLRDNVEQIVIDTPTPGTYLLTLSHKGTLVDGPQSFSIVVDGARLEGIFADGFETGNTSEWSSATP